jgi:UDP-glucose 4-epimerase
LKILITGGAGFIGRHLVNRYLEIGGEVVVVDSGFTGNLGAVNAEASLINTDITFLSIDDWVVLLKDVNFVFHLAAQKLNTKNITPTDIIQTNINATYNIAQASRIAQVERVIFTSSLYSYGNLGPNKMLESDAPRPRTLYGSTKLMGENILNSISNEFNFNWNVARLFFVYGPGQFSTNSYKSVIVKNFERLKNNLPPIINGSGLQSLDYVYVDDAVSALMRLSAIATSHNVVNIASGKSVSIGELTMQMQEVAGTEFEPIHSPADWTEGTNRIGDIELARNLLRWSPSTSLIMGLNNVWRSLND